MRYTMRFQAGVPLRGSINLERQEMGVKQTGKHKQCETPAGERRAERRSWKIHSDSPLSAQMQTPQRPRTWGE